MGKGKKHESAAQERKNLLGINPIPDHASGSWMSKHSIASSGSNSPLHENGVFDKISAGYKTAKKTVKDALRNSEFNRSSNIDLKGRGDYQSQRSRGGHIFGTPDKTVKQKVSTAKSKIQSKIDKQERDKFWNQPDVKNYLAQK